MCFFGTEWQKLLSANLWIRAEQKLPSTAQLIVDTSTTIDKLPAEESRAGLGRVKIPGCRSIQQARDADSIRSLITEAHLHLSRGAESHQNGSDKSKKLIHCQFRVQIRMAPITPGTHAHSVSAVTSRIEPQPLSITAKGGKIKHNKARKHDILQSILKLPRKYEKKHPQPKNKKRSCGTTPKLIRKFAPEPRDVWCPRRRITTGHWAVRLHTKGV